MTSSPTKAMFAAAVGQPFHIPFGGRGIFQYADDVAKTFIASARAPFAGVEIFNLTGSVVHMREVVDAITMAAPASTGQITFDDTALALPEDIAATVLKPLTRSQAVWVSGSRDGKPQQWLYLNAGACPG